MSSCYFPQPNYITWHAVTKIINCRDTEGEDEYYETVFIGCPRKFCRHNSGVWMEECLGAQKIRVESHMCWQWEKMRTLLLCKGVQLLYRDIKHVLFFVDYEIQNKMHSKTTQHMGKKRAMLSCINFIYLFLYYYYY
jgi:hypothetical protein